MATPDHDQRCLLVDGMTTGGRPAMTASLLKIISLRLRDRRLVKRGGCMPGRGAQRVVTRTRRARSDLG